MPSPGDRRGGSPGQGRWCGSASTMRPSQDAPALAGRMSQAGVTRVVVTRPAGALAGMFFAAEVSS